MGEMIPRPGPGQDGYGPADKELAAALRAARTRAAADAAAHASGLADAADAVAWLAERS